MGDRRRTAGLLLVGLGATLAVVSALGLAGVIGGDSTDTTRRDASTASSAQPVAVGTSSEAPAETPQAFFVALSSAIHSRDTNFLFARLHPFVLERYGEPACQAYLAGLNPAFDAQVLSVVGSGSFDWTTDGLVRTIPDATTVRLRSTQDGSTYTEADGHVVVVSGQVRWLTDCGTPTNGAR